MEHFLIYRFGTHYVNVKVDVVEFKKVIDDMSNEFTIHKNYIKELGILEFFIFNYWGDKEIIGLFLD